MDLDSYQAIYDAVRSRIGQLDLSRVLDFSLEAQKIQDDISWHLHRVTGSMRRPSVLFHPTLGKDGSKWCALYGADIMEGVCGFGNTPAEAMAAFDLAWEGKTE